MKKIRDFIHEEKPFSEIPIGKMFVVKQEENKWAPKIWVKTPFAPMYEYDNDRYNKCGAICTAVCITSKKDQPEYMQCDPKAVCCIVSAEQVFARCGVLCC